MFLAALTALWAALTLGAVLAVSWDATALFLIGALVLLGFPGAWWIAGAAWLAVPTLGLILCIKRALSGRYRAAAAWGFAPILAILLATTGPQPADATHFAVQRGAYEEVIADAKAGRCADHDRRRWNVPIDLLDCQQPVVIAFVWGGFGSDWHGVVYDETDEFWKPHAVRSDGWKARPAGEHLACSGAKRALGGHFYRAGGFLIAGGDCG